MSLNYRAGSVSFENVTKTFGDVKAIDNVSFTIEPGNLVTLLGPSGCGKTTTLRMIAGLEHPACGRIMIGGKDVTALPATDRDVSMVFQSYALFPHMSVAENVAYGLTASGMKKTEALQKSAEGLELVGLADFRFRMPNELSGGQQQRVAVARALVLEPEVLLLDEPLSNLDAKLRRHVREEIRELQQKIGLTAVYVTHDQEEALAVSDRIIVMNRAVISQEGSPRELYEQPASTFIADFIGDANLVDAEIINTNQAQAEVAVGTLRYSLALRDFKIGRVKLAVRPSAIRLSLAAEKTSGLAGNVRRATYLGSQMHYEVDCELGRLFVVDFRVDKAIAVGSDVSISFSDRGLALVDTD